MKSGLFFFAFILLVIGSEALPQLQKLEYLQDESALSGSHNVRNKREIIQDGDEDLVLDDDVSKSRDKRDAEQAVEVEGADAGADIVLYVKQVVDMGGCCYSGCNGGCAHECSEEEEATLPATEETTTAA